MDNKIAILGPKYSFSHLLALKKFPSEDYSFCDKINDVFKAVIDNKVRQGIVPIENMLNGTVRESIMSLLKYRIKINKSYNLQINYCIAAKNNEYQKIVSHSQALAQCSTFLEEKEIQEGKQVLKEDSTSKAMKIASEDQTFAALGSLEAAKHYGLNIIQNNVGDLNNNATRFMVISNQESGEESEGQEGEQNIFSGNVRTSLMLTPNKDRPGLLFQILAPFATQGINLTKIESLPSRRKLGEYIFYLEIDGNVNELKIKSAIDFLKTSIEVYSFGSYEVRDER